METLQGLENLIMDGVSTGRYRIHGPVPEEVLRYIRGERLPRMPAEEYAAKLAAKTEKLAGEGSGGNGQERPN